MQCRLVADLFVLEKGKSYGFQGEVSLNKGEFFVTENWEEFCSKMLRVSFDKKSYSEEVRHLFSEVNAAAQYVELINRMWGGTVLNYKGESLKCRIGCCAVALDLFWQKERRAVV